MSLRCPETMAGSLGVAVGLTDCIVQLAAAGAVHRRLSDFLLHPTGVLEYLAFVQTGLACSNQAYRLYKQSENSWIDVLRLSLHALTSLLSLGCTVAIITEAYLAGLTLTTIAFALCLALLVITECRFQHLLIWRAAMGIRTVQLFYMLIMHAVLYAKRLRWSLDIDYYHSQEYNLALAAFLVFGTAVAISVSSISAAAGTAAVFLTLTVQSILKWNMGAFRSMCIGCLVLSLLACAQTACMVETRQSKKCMQKEI